jgi:hypothetical protein
VERSFSRYCAAALGFAFVAVWVGLGFTTAVFGLIACIACYLGAPIVQGGIGRTASGGSTLRALTGLDAIGNRHSRRAAPQRARRSARGTGRPRGSRERVPPVLERAGEDPELELTVPLEAARRAGYGWQ